MDLEVIDRLEVLPYWWAWADWETHLDRCPECWTAMDQNSPDGDDLCTTGSAAWMAAAASINRQQNAAAHN